MASGTGVDGYCSTNLADLVDISNQNNCAGGAGENFGAYYNAQF